MVARAVPGVVYLAVDSMTEAEVEDEVEGKAETAASYKSRAPGRLDRCHLS